MGTSVLKAIHVEVRTNIYDIAVMMMSKCAHSKRLRKRSQLSCQDVADIRISIVQPYADATIVFWNNILFEQRVVEFVKVELSGMFLLGTLLSCLNFCPRHRDLCQNRSAERSS
ncbi:hypothetical protein PHMEG_00022155 [Phytophthora megakarya]|uniref:Uncharacterized protein n=1 Tax=Phytophthora megakarya TaxID=4795 RepID=A0A225VK53_9STRA|nr:hypothetical protein PHMEG_00022155 [Phytophthora megakarya]